MSNTKTDRELIRDYLFSKLDKVMKKPYGNYNIPLLTRVRPTTATFGTGTRSGRCTP